MSKCSLEGPGGTSEDLSLASLSEILADEHQFEMFMGFQPTQAQEHHQSQSDDKEEVVSLNDVVVEETKEAGYSKAEEESRVIIVNDKLTNLSANSAEVKVESKLNFHSLERIRQESGGS